jgi:hypothetical protein
MINANVQLSPVEAKIMEILTNDGVDPKDIEFQKASHGTILRVGYWDRLTQFQRTALAGMIVEDLDIYDDDCGWLMCYRIVS